MYNNQLDSDERAYLMLEVKRLSDKVTLTEKHEDDEEPVTRFSIANSELSDAVSEYVQIHGDNLIMHEDVSAWGAPSECHADVNKSFEKQLHEFYEKHGFRDEEHFFKVVSKRTSDRWVYFGLQNAIGRYLYYNSPFVDERRK